jgi:hypothetical protein
MLRAAAEFQKILDHRGVVVNEPIGALAHLEIARAVQEATYQLLVNLLRKVAASVIELERIGGVSAQQSSFLEPSSIALAGVPDTLSATRK